MLQAMYGSRRLSQRSDEYSRDTDYSEDFIAIAIVPSPRGLPDASSFLRAASQSVDDLALYVKMHSDDDAYSDCIRDFVAIPLEDLMMLCGVHMHPRHRAQRSLRGRLHMQGVRDDWGCLLGTDSSPGHNSGGGDARFRPASLPLLRLTVSLRVLDGLAEFRAE